MDLVRLFFSLNRDIIYFAYGLVFFVLGLAIALQSRNYSRLDLARCLQWLAAFGFVHAFNEWGDLFIPIQENYANPDTILWLHRIHLLLLAVSYAFLFEFGVTLLKPLGLARWVHRIPALLLGVWFIFLYRSCCPISTPGIIRPMHWPAILSVFLGGCWLLTVSESIPCTASSHCGFLIL